MRVLAVSSIRQTAPAKPAFARAITAESPMLLVFEDLHRVDLSTVDLSSSRARRSLQKTASAWYARFEGRVAH